MTNFNSDEEEFRAAEREIKAIASKRLFNRAQTDEFFLKEIMALQNIPFENRPFPFNSDFLEEAIETLPDDAFCKIIDVMSCARTTKEKVCACSIKLLFGGETIACSIETFHAFEGQCTVKALKKRVECMIVSPFDCNKKAIDEICSPYINALTSCQNDIDNIKQIIRDHKKQISGKVANPDHDE